MKTRIAAGLAFLLVAGASPAALAQEHDHDREASRAQSTIPAPAAPAAPPLNRGPSGPPGGPHSGEPAGSQSVRGQAAPGPTYQRQGPSGQGYQGQGGGGRSSPNGGPGLQHFERGPGPGEGGQRQYDRGPNPGSGAGHDFERERGPREIVPPGAAERGNERGGDRNFEARREGHNNPWGGGPGGTARWQPGRAPSVYWSNDRFHAGAYRQPYGYYVRSWGYGDILPRGWYVQNYWLNDFLDFGLPYPPPGTEWVRVGGDALLLDQYTGRIIQIVRGIFW